jgi:hypothetical protein
VSTLAVVPSKASFAKFLVSRAIFKQPAFCVMLGLGIILLDSFTSEYLLVAILHIIPVALAAWYTRGNFAYALSLVLPIANLGMILFIEHSVPPHYAIINALIQIGVLLAIAFACRVIRQNLELKQHVKALESILPICMGCKKIRSGDQDWQTLEAYVTEHTDSVVSHGICPECARKLYPR